MGRFIKAIAFIRLITIRVLSSCGQGQVAGAAQGIPLAFRVHCSELVREAEIERNIRNAWASSLKFGFNLYNLDNFRVKIRSRFHPELVIVTSSST